MSQKHRTPFREQIKYPVIFTLIAVIGFSTYHVVNDLFNDASTVISQERPQIQQKRIRYRFRRIYNGGDVMTASHNGVVSGPSLTTTSPCCVVRGLISAPVPTNIGRRHTAAGGTSWGVVTTMESQQQLRSYTSGGGSMGGNGSYSGGSTGGLGGGISAGGGYAVSIPALSSLKATGSANGNLAALNEETATAGRNKRGVKVFNGSWWYDSDSEEGGRVDGEGNVYDSEGNLIGHYNSYSGEFVSQGSVDAGSQAPIGAPLLPLLSLALLYPILSAHRKEEQDNV